MSENTVSYTTNPAFPEWQPIETAPENEYVLIARDGYPPTVAKNRGRWGWELAAAGSFASDSTPDGEPTHWMPLPPSPGGAQ